MIVKELIKELTKHDPDLHVYATWEGQTNPIQAECIKRVKQGTTKQALRMADWWWQQEGIDHALILEVD